MHLAGVSHKLHHNLTVHGRVLEKGTSGCLSLCHGETPSSDGRRTQDATYGKLKGVKVCYNPCCWYVTQILIVCPRLSRPSLQYQYPLPNNVSGHELAIDPRASLANPNADPADNFIVTPVLTLPESFQSAYVGEEFSCTVCANNELPPGDYSRSISAVRVEAEMQTPSKKDDTPLEFADGTDVDTEGKPFLPGDSIQKIMRLNLNEPGQHVLAVTVTYTETQLTEDGEAAGGRVRTFRKLYQFKATTLIGVKTKAGDVQLAKDGVDSYALEAQLENLGDRTVTLEVRICSFNSCLIVLTMQMQAVNVTPRAPFKSSSLNWDIFGTGSDPPHSPILYPGEVMQVAFLLEGQKGESPTSQASDRPVLGQLSIQWRSAMGDRGFLTTGWLSGRKR
jgi:hypothetical protein